MKVRCWDSTGRTFFTLESLVNEIKASGTVATSALPAGIPIHSVYYLLGGRASISSLFELTPGGAFLGPQLYSKYARLSKLTKTYTVIAIVSFGYTGSLGKHTKHWKDLVGTSQDSRKSITFSEITDELWGAEQRVQARVIDYMGLGEDEPEQEPVVTIPLARGYKDAPKRTWAGAKI